MGLSVMNKSAWVIGLLVFLGWSQIAWAGHEALELLLANGQMRLKSQSLCEPYQLAEAPTIDSQTLAQDIAWVMADMSEKLIAVESDCSMNEQNKKQCKVIYSVSEGELEWARVYQFEDSATRKNPANLKDLKCFNLP